MKPGLVFLSGVPTVRGSNPRTASGRGLWCGLLASAIVVVAACSSPRREEVSKAGEPPRPTATESVEITPATGNEIRTAISRSNARATVVNVWATWCLPCREEFPDLVRLYRAYRDTGVALVLVSADFEDQLPAAREFLAEQGVDFPSFAKRGGDAEFIDALDPRWSGALPATWIYDADGVIRHFREGKTTFHALEQELLQVLRQRARGPTTQIPSPSGGIHGS